jgi:protein-serine/threonine kinase
MYAHVEVIIGRGHTSTVDWWTYGILLYEMRFGRTPFRGRNQDDTFSRVLDSTVKFPEDVIASKDLKTLIRKLLHKDPKKRLGGQYGASEIKDHSFFKSVSWALIRNQTPPIVPKVSHPLDTQNFRNLPDTDTDLLEDGIDSMDLDDSNPFRDFKSGLCSRGSASSVDLLVCCVLAYVCVRVCVCVCVGWLVCLLVCRV